MERSPEYRLEISFDGRTWREMPLGYRQDGIVLANEDGIVTQSIGRGVVRYRAVPVDAGADVVTAGG